MYYHIYNKGTLKNRKSITQTKNNKYNNGGKQMNTRTLVIFDEEKQYANLLMDFFSSKRDVPFQTVTFTDKSKLFQFLYSQKVDMLLISASAMDEEIEECDVKEIILLSDGRVPTEFSSYPSIYKFKSAENIFREVLEKLIEVETDKDTMVVSKGKAKVIGVYSPVGRSGKTTFAIALAQILSEGHKTLFISFEEFAVFQNEIETSSPGNLADLMYYFKQNPDTVSIKLQAIVQKVNSMDFVSPIYYARDLRETTTEEWKELLDYLSAVTSYEYIVLDIGDMIGDLLSMLDYCDQIFMPTVEDKLSEMKINKIETVILQSDKEKLLDKIIKTKAPQPENNYMEERWMETIGLGNVGDYIRALLKQQV